MPLPDDFEEWPDEWPEAEAGKLTVTFTPQEPLWLELPDGTFHEWWPGFGFTA